MGQTTPGIGRKELRAAMLEMRAELMEEIRREGFYYMGEKRYDPILWDINNGYCEEFGEGVLAKLGRPAEVWCNWLDEVEVEYDGRLPGHYFLEFEGRYYDAECLDGVDNILDLPIFLDRNREQTIDAVVFPRKGRGPGV